MDHVRIGSQGLFFVLNSGVSMGELVVPDLERIPLCYSSSSFRPSESPASVPLVRKIEFLKEL